MLTARSDDLARLSSALSTLGLPDSIAGRFQVRLVVDSSVILTEICYLARSRRKPGARTALQEAVASRTVILVAPNDLKTEVERHIPRRAAEINAPAEHLNLHWQEYEKVILFQSPKDLPPLRGAEYVALKERDEDDLPFLEVMRMVNASAILTEDKHFSRSGIPAIPLALCIDLREYARGRALEMQIMVGGMAVGLVGIGAITGFFKGIEALLTIVKRMPPIIQFLMFIGLVIAIVHPRSQAAIGRFLANLGEHARRGWEAIEPAVLKMAEQSKEAQIQSSQHLGKVKMRLERQGARPPALSHIAYGICISAGQPLAAEEIQRLALAEGYKPRGLDSLKYLRRILGSDSRFQICAGGKWAPSMPGRAESQIIS